MLVSGYSAETVVDGIPIPHELLFIPHEDFSIIDTKNQKKFIYCSGTSGHRERRRYEDQIYVLSTVRSGAPGSIHEQHQLLQLLRRSSFC